MTLDLSIILSLGQISVKIYLVTLFSFIGLINSSPAAFISIVFPPFELEFSIKFDPQICSAQALGQSDSTRE